MPESNAEITDDLARALGELDEHAGEYQRRRDFYDGKVEEFIAHPMLARMLNAYAKPFNLNYAAVPVDALMDRVDLSSLAITGGGDLSARLKADFWDANELSDDADDYHSKAAYFGDYYALVWPAPGEDGKSPTMVEMFGKSPIHARILYEQANSRVPDIGIYRWGKGKKHRAALYYDDATIDFIDDNGDGSDAKRYRRLEHVPGDEGVTSNEWGFPMFHWRPDAKPYGRPVNSRGYGPQMAITKINATHMVAVDYQGAPQRYALLDPNAESDDDIADDFNDDTVTAPPLLDTDLSRVSREKTASLKATPGSAWLLSGVKAVGEFTPASEVPFINAEKFQIRAMATLTRTPLYEFDLDGTGDAPSGEARRRADIPITKHAVKIQGSFGNTWAQIGAFVLKIWGLDGAGKTVEAMWAPIEMATDKDGLELVALKIENGVPPRDALMQAGYTLEQVDEWMPKSAVPATPALLATLATLLRDLGQAKTLGAVSTEDIRLMLPNILAGAAPEPPAPAPVIMAAPLAPAPGVPIAPAPMMTPPPAA